MNVKVEGQSRPRYLGLMQPSLMQSTCKLWISWKKKKKYTLPEYAAIQKRIMTECNKHLLNHISIFKNINIALKAHEHFTTKAEL